MSVRRSRFQRVKVPPHASSTSSREADDPADLGAPLSYAVEALAEDDEDLDPAAAALSKSRHWVLTALRAGGDLQTVKQLGTASLRPAIRSSPAPSKPL
jgi:hypothetical protein